MSAKKALIIVDVQNDFVSGSLAVPGGAQVIEPINALLQQDWDVVIATKDWHPANHVSFASSHGKAPGAGIEIVSTAGKVSQEPGWPDHCVQDTWGAQAVDGLNTDSVNFTVLKGRDVNREFYSAFDDIFGEQSTNLDATLHQNNIDEVYVVGLALDYCVMNTAVDATKHGFRTKVILDSTRAITDEGARSAREKLSAAGVVLLNSYYI